MTSLTEYWLKRRGAVLLRKERELKAMRKARRAMKIARIKAERLQPDHITDAIILSPNEDAE